MSAKDNAWQVSYFPSERDQVTVVVGYGRTLDIAVRNCLEQAHAQVAKARAVADEIEQAIS